MFTPSPNVGKKKASQYHCDFKDLTHEEVSFVRAYTVRSRTMLVALTVGKGYARPTRFGWLPPNRASDKFSLSFARAGRAPLSSPLECLDGHQSDHERSPL